MKDIIKFFKYVGEVIFLSVFLIILTFFVIVSYPKNVFATSYQSVIQTKYDNLVNTEKPKIIIIAGSSAAFGINEEMLREATGYEVVNLGVHGGMGGLFETEISKANIREGDIVLLGYEYGWGASDYFEKFGIDLVMSGIDSRIDMYRWIPCDNYDEVFGYLFTYAGKKIQFVEPKQTIYARESFDEKGEMIYERNECTIENYSERIDYYGNVVEENLKISEESSEYIKKFKNFVENKGGRIYFIAPPLLEDAYQGEQEYFTEFCENAKKSTGIEYISDPQEYLFPYELMFDTIYHCNSEGEVVRTKLLIEDLKEVL